VLVPGPGGSRPNRQSCEGPTSSTWTALSSGSLRSNPLSSAKLAGYPIRCGTRQRPSVLVSVSWLVPLVMLTLVMSLMGRSARGLLPKAPPPPLQEERLPW
jgi:hypothetical protein